jgi:hypothetical protein
MLRSMLPFALAISTCTFPAAAQQPDSHDKSFDVHSSVGDLHVGADADARKAGLPLYPGARLRHDEKDSDPINLGAFTEAFGLKLVIAKYDSEDAPGKVADYYRDKLKKYGRVIECHTREQGGDAHAVWDNDQHSKELKCEGDNTGPVTELKVGTEDNQHIVAVEPAEGHSGTTFALVYLRARGKHGDI